MCVCVLGRECVCDCLCVFALIYIYIYIYDLTSKLLPIFGTPRQSHLMIQFFHVHETGSNENVNDEGEIFHSFFKNFIKLSRLV